MFSPQLPEHSEKLINEHRLTFPLVQDPQNALAEKLGLTHGFSDKLSATYLQFGIDVPASNGTREWTLPMPARYLVDTNGLIRDAAINPNYTKRPDPNSMVDLLSLL